VGGPGAHPVESALAQAGRDGRHGTGARLLRGLVRRERLVARAVWHPVRVSLGLGLGRDRVRYIGQDASDGERLIVRAARLYGECEQARESLRRRSWRAGGEHVCDAACRPTKSEHGPRVRATGSSSTSEAKSSRPPSPRSPPTRSSSAASSRASGAPRTRMTRYSWTGTRTRSACCSRACGTARRYFPRRTRSSVPGSFSSISTEQLKPKTIADSGNPS
jgi:hypothetical protein